jgi:small subunit ribosomal protein S20
VRSKVKTYIKKLNAAIKSKDAGKVEEALKEVMKVISSAASKGVLHRNTASRYISRLSKKAHEALKSEAA